LATVGYGDYPAKTVSELIVCLVWMAFGVNFYSFLVGSVTSNVMSEAANKDNLNYKLK
jgi:Ion channel